MFFLRGSFASPGARKCPLHNDRAASPGMLFVEFTQFEIRAKHLELVGCLHFELSTASDKLV